MNSKMYPVSRKDNLVVQELEGEARTREIGRMLSGRLTPEALKHAEQLLRAGTSG